ncbi:hypothetical protein ACFW04_004180 [Cataglyphis niger]
MADYLSAELTATCAVLGYFDGTDYHLDKNCLDVIKDLIRYLRRDDDTHTIRRFLGRTKLLQTDLVKIFIHHVKYTELWDVLLRLLINLTSSTFVIYNEQIPTEKTMYSLYQQINSHLQEYKAALTDENVWLTVAGRLGKLLNIDSTERGEENELTLERILVFIRNVLQVPPNDNDKRGDNDATVHDEILFAFHASGIVDILLFIVSNNKEQQYHMQILEIISLMLREQNASQLAASGLQRSTAEKENDEAKLVALRKKELHEKMDKIKKYAGSRHSRFGGTYIVRNMKATGENQMICHKPYQKIETLEFGHNKKRVKRRKDKMGVQDAKVERTSVLSVRLFLKEFCVEFLSGAYNPVMKFARSCIINVTQGEASETTSYLWALRFFMEFNRHYKFEVKYVSETISTEVFYLVQRQMEQYYEMMITDKKKIPLWSRRLHLALKAYQELLNTLMVMDKSIDHGVKESSKIIKSNIFYVPEYRETILSQLLCFDETKMSRQYLVDLITTLHIFLKMLEHFCQKGQRHLVVQQMKLKRKKAKKRKKPAHQESATPAPTLEERWDIIGPELSAIMRDAVIPEMIPFDATLDTPIDDQKSDAMKKIQNLMRQRNLEQALGLLRAAREIWPENDCFGRADMPPEEEFLALREIFFADLGAIIVIEYCIQIEIKHNTDLFYDENCVFYKTSFSVSKYLHYRRSERSDHEREVNDYLSFVTRILHQQISLGSVKIGTPRPLSSDQIAMHRVISCDFGVSQWYSNSTFNGVPVSRRQPRRVNVSFLYVNGPGMVVGPGVGDLDGGEWSADVEIIYIVTPVRSESLSPRRARCAFHFLSIIFHDSVFYCLYESFYPAFLLAVTPEPFSRAPLHSTCSIFYHQDFRFPSFDFLLRSFASFIQFPFFEKYDASHVSNREFSESSASDKLLNVDISYIYIYILNKFFCI